MTPLAKLKEIQNFSGPRLTQGLPDTVLAQFLETTTTLKEAIAAAYENFQDLKQKKPELLRLSEKDQIHHLQESYINFYNEFAINPYVPLAARGPWIITTAGAVVIDVGGYGMLGYGHGFEPIQKALSKSHTMANIMTASFQQHELANLLKKEIGHNRSPSVCPYSKFICLNSGSESVTLASRLSDIHAKLQTDHGAKHEGKKIKFLVLEGSFHGRTERPSKASHSSIDNYKKHLASFRHKDPQVSIPPNDIPALEAAFAEAEKKGIFFELFFMEPVMGEGDPGKGISPAFYQRARELTKEHDTLLLVDSIQAGMRAHGVLSIVDYPGFEQLEAPDFETYSKAINGGHYPLSIVAIHPRVADLYKPGIYGNTMTSNPKALDVACAVLNALTPQLRQNIVARGKEFLEKLNELAKEFPNFIKKVQGTGLLFSVEMNKDHFQVTGKDNLEYELRLRGLGVIHGGVNALRFTPNFTTTSQEVSLVVSLLKETMKGHT